MKTKSTYRIKNEKTSLANDYSKNKDIQLEARISEVDSSNKSILIVDDEEFIRELLEECLGDEGYHCMTAMHPIQALEILKENNFSLVITDIKMPQMDGIEFLRRVKEHNSNIKVIVITAFLEIDKAINALKFGADDFFLKPLDIDEVTTSVKNAIETKKLIELNELLFSELQVKHAELIEKYQQLEELEKLKHNLTHMVIHDLKTPLASMSAILQTIEYKSRKNATEHLSDKASKGILLTKRMSNMVNNLLDISKMEENKLKLNRKKYNLNNVIKEKFDDIMILSANKPITMKLEISDIEINILMDADKISRVLENLLANALKHTFEGGISIGYRLQNENEVLVYVKDTGVGIPSEYKNKIFEKFFQVDQYSSRGNMNTGLGLTFCKMAVEAHGGQIWVESKLDEGSTFQFTLPISTFD